jgi:hypothetical protein
MGWELDPEKLKQSPLKRDPKLFADIGEALEKSAEDKKKQKDESPTWGGQ